MDDTNSTDNPTAAHPADHVDTPSAAQSTVIPPAQKRSPLRAALIAGGAVLAAAVLAGGGFAVGAAIADDDEGDDSETVNVEDQDDDASRDTTAADGSAIGTASADDLIDIADAAAAAAEGDPVSIELKRDGIAEVTLEAADGAETELRVVDGQASVVSTDDPDSDDSAPAAVLDDAAIRAIVEAALGEADSRVLEIDADDDGTSLYDVTVVTGTGDISEIGLDADFGIVSTDDDTGDDTGDDTESDDDSTDTDD